MSDVFKLTPCFLSGCRRSQPHNCSLPQLTGYIECAANGHGALSHPGESVVAGRGLFLFIRSKTPPVVPHFHGDVPWSVFQLDRKIFGAGVLLHIMDRFLGDTQDFALGARRAAAGKHRKY